jgi:methyl-accepting chemotaxis protein
MLDVFNNRRLTRKMLLLFVPFCVVTIALATAMIAHRQIAAVQRQHVERDLSVIRSAMTILGDLRENRDLTLSYVKTDDAAEAAQIAQRVGRTRDALDREIGRLAGASGPDFAPDVARLRGAVVAQEEMTRKIMASRDYDRGDDTRARDRGDDTLAPLDTSALNASHAGLDAADALVAHMARQAADDGARLRAFGNGLLSLILVLALVSAGVMALVWRIFKTTIARPMTDLAAATTTLAEGSTTAVPHSASSNQTEDMRSTESHQAIMAALGQALSAVAQGDLTAEIDGEFCGETAALKSDFNEALARLRDMIGSVADSAEGIRTGSSEIAQAAEDLARRTESNAASLEETSAALVQIDERLKATANAAGRTVGRANQAIATVGTGRTIADEAVQAMERVRDSATGIDSVIEGLDKIAFQTRVLAMNAAVEAGRAGDAGRGFAVVADLVSSLAMRAEEEAKRARDQLTVTQTDVVTAVEAVQRVDGAFADISNDVGEVHSLLDSIATDNQAQSSALTQISAAISSMDQSTQQNAAMVEQTSAAARNLNSEVTSLARQAALFKVGEHDRGVSPRKTARAITMAAPAQPYVSPVGPLQMPVIEVANGAYNGAGAMTEDWSDF